MLLWPTGHWKPFLPVKGQRLVLFDKTAEQWAQLAV